MLATILGFITGLAGPIAQTIGKITDLKLAQVQAASDSEKARINLEIQESQDRKAALIAEAGTRLGSTIHALLRLGFAIGPLAVLNKIFLWDKVVGSFVGCSGNMTEGMWDKCKIYVTDSLDIYLWGVITAIVAFYFVYDMTAGRRRS